MCSQLGLVAFAKMLTWWSLNSSSAFDILSRWDTTSSLFCLLLRLACNNSWTWCSCCLCSCLFTFFTSSMTMRSWCNLFSDFWQNLVVSLALVWNCYHHLTWQMEAYPPHLIPLEMVQQQQLFFELGNPGNVFQSMTTDARHAGTDFNSVWFPHMCPTCSIFYLWRSHILQSRNLLRIPMCKGVASRVLVVYLSLPEVVK